MELINGFVVLIFPESQNWWFFDFEISKNWNHR
jgi:hypothetical protein